MAYHNRLGNNGRFGNQLFQIAATYALSKRINEPLFFPTVWEFAHLFPNLQYSIGTGPARLYREPHYHYAPIPKQPKANLEGYFQSTQYWKGMDAEIRHIFSMPDVVQADTIAIHIRRTDYVALSHTHTNLKMDYYERAMEWMRRMVPGAQFKVFSDDIGWCQQQEAFANCVFSSNYEQIADFKEMIGCKNLIIANSSYSWWAAWLSNQPGKIVIAPFHWFSNWKFADFGDVVPPEWLIVNAGHR